MHANKQDDGPRSGLTPAQRERLMGMLIGLGRDDHTNGILAAVEMPPIMARMVMTLGTPTLDERVAKLRSAQDAAEHVAEVRAYDAQHEHSDECDGRCGPTWFYGEVIDAIEEVVFGEARTAASVRALLTSMGVPERDAQEADDARA